MSLKKSHTAIIEWAREYSRFMLEEVERILKIPMPENPKKKKGEFLLLEISFDEGRMFEDKFHDYHKRPYIHCLSSLMQVGFNAGRKYQHENPDESPYISDRERIY